MDATATICELLKRNQGLVSIEVTPEINANTLKGRNVEWNFVSVTWHASKYDNFDLNIEPLKVARRLKAMKLNVLLHLSCERLRIEYLDVLLEHLRENGIRNIFAILGESFDDQFSAFKTTMDLITYIKNKWGSYFCIGVAGYPNNDGTLAALKQKIDSGADFIITQAFFEIDDYCNFKLKCEENNINVPIIPGLFIYEHNDQLQKLSSLCNVKIPDHIMNSKKSPEEILTALMKTLIQRDQHINFHIFTMNKITNVDNFLEGFRNNKY